MTAAVLPSSNELQEAMDRIESCTPHGVFENGSVSRYRHVLDKDWQTIRDALLAMQRERNQHIAWLAECVKLSGADISGGTKGDVDEDWRLAPRAVEEVSRLREDHDVACEHQLRLMQQLAESERVCGSLQAKIDSLMLEYCPDEMTPEQVEEWGRNQVPVPQDEAARIEAAIGKIGGG